MQLRLNIQSETFALFSQLERTVSVLQWTVTRMSVRAASCSCVASFPGPTQLSVACSTVSGVLQATESWAGPGNEASSCVRRLAAAALRTRRRSYIS